MVDSSPYKTEWIAKQLGYTLQTFYQIRAGQRPMGANKVDLLAHILGRSQRTVRKAATDTYREKQEATS